MHRPAPAHDRVGGGPVGIRRIRSGGSRQGEQRLCGGTVRTIEKPTRQPVFSPESISTALAMTYAGARGDTAAEMAKALHFTLPQEQLHPAMGALLNDLNTPH